MGLNEAQKRAVSHGEGPCLVLAGPGSGKTLTIARRIEYLIKRWKVRPEEILVITFTKYAAGEMRERFRKVMGDAGTPVTFGTFHGIYYGILRWAYGINQENFLSEEEKRQLIRKISGRAGMMEDRSASEEKEFLQELAGEIGRVKNNDCRIEEYQPSCCSPEHFREFYEAYEKEKEKDRKIDFDDMLLKCRYLFRGRPDILKKWQERFRYILVDEFQDINQVQYDVLKMLAAPEDNLFVVGDDDQSVYGFRGAKPGIMQHFRKDYPRAAGIVLDVNYRCAGSIVKGAGQLISSNRNRYEKDIRAYKENGQEIHVQASEDAVEESRYVLSRIREEREKGVPYEQMAVLFRTAACGRAVAEIFARHQIPYFMAGHMEHIYEHFTCMDMNSYFRLALGGYERKDVLQIMNRPNRYISRESLSEEPVTYESLRDFYCDKKWMQERIDELEQDMGWICAQTPYAAVQYIRKSMGYEEFLRDYCARRHVDEEEAREMLDEVQEHTKGFRTLEEWLSHVEECVEQLKRGDKAMQKGEGVSLLTMHGAKGLEFETVFIIHVNEGITPYQKARTDEELEEERRLFYVAVTRAKEKLTISYVEEKNGREKPPSRFVKELRVPT